MYKLLLCLVFFIQYQKTFAHVALTFPPARTYIFDYFDNSRFARRGPCGMSKTEGEKFLLLGNFYVIIRMVDVLSKAAD